MNEFFLQTFLDIFLLDFIYIKTQFNIDVLSFSQWWATDRFARTLSAILLLDLLSPEALALKQSSDTSVVVNLLPVTVVLFWALLSLYLLLVLISVSNFLLRSLCMLSDSKFFKNFNLSLEHFFVSSLFKFLLLHGMSLNNASVCFGIRLYDDSMFVGLRVFPAHIGLRSLRIIFIGELQASADSVSSSSSPSALWWQDKRLKKS